MPRRSRKVAARQASLAGRRKLKRQQKPRPEITTVDETPKTASDEGSKPKDLALDAEEVAAETEEVETTPKPTQEAIEEVATAPWPYAYVLKDVKRIGIFSAGIFVIIGILSLTLR